jgi:uncharacterized membrane protein
MNNTLIGLVLIILGAVALAYQGITYTTREKVVDIGPIEATKKETKTIPLPPVLGGVALVGGVALLIAGRRVS